MRCNHCKHYRKRTSRTGECKRIQIEVTDTRNDTVTHLKTFTNKYYLCKSFVDGGFDDKRSELSV